MNKEKQNFNINMVGWVIPHLLYKIRVDQETKNKAKLIKENLSDNENKSYVIYWNHTTRTDFFGASCVQHLIEPMIPRNLVSMISVAHLENDKEAKILKWFLNKCGVEVLPVVQSQMVSEENKVEALRNYKKILKRFCELGKEEKPTGLFIAPEGHRSDDGQLGEGKNGIVVFGESLKPVIFIPVGVNFEKGFTRDSLNLGKEINVRIGEILEWKNGDEKIKVENLMNRVRSAIIG